MSRKVKEFRISRVSWESTRRLFAEAAALLPAQRLSSDFSGIVHLSPFPSALGDIQSVFQEEVFGAHEIGCYIPPEISTPVVYAKKCFVPDKGFSVAASRILPLIISRLSGKGLGYSALTANFLHDLKTHFPGESIENLRSLFLKVFNEKGAPDTLSNNIDEVFGIIKRLEEFLRERYLITEDDAVNRFAPVSGCDVLILEGFYAPLPAEKAVIAKLCEVADNILIAPAPVIQSSGREDALSVFVADHLKKCSIRFERTAVEDDQQKRVQELLCCPAQGIEEEMEAVARSIKSVYMSGMHIDLNKVVVATPDIKTYEPVAERVLTRYGIPFSLRRATSGPMPEPFSDILSLLRSVADDYPRLEFTRFLSSRFFKKIPHLLVEYISRLSPLSGVISGMDSWIYFITEGTDTFDPSVLADRAAIEDGFKEIFTLLEPLRLKRLEAEIAEYNALLKRFLDDLGFDPDSKTLEKLLTEALDVIAFSAESLPGRASLQEFADMLEYVLKSSRQEPGTNGVRVMDIYEAAGLCPDRLYLCGMTEQKIPSLPDIDYLLPDAVKRSVGLKDMDRHMEIQRALFDMLISSACCTRLSYPEMENDNLYLPSPFLYGIALSRQKIPGIYSEEELQLSRPGQDIADSIPEISGVFGVSPPESYTKVTDIDAYRTCPRRYFLEKALLLSPPEIKEYEVAARTIGTMSHAIMERLMKEPLGAYEAFSDRAAAIAQDVLAATKINDYWKDICLDAFTGMLPEIYETEAEIRGKEYRRSVLEMNISGEPVQGLRIKGKIDRFDIIGAEAQVVDYKSGSADLNCSQALKARENLQLFLYAAMLQQKDRIKVKRAGIYSLNKISVKWCPPKSRRKNGQDVGDMETYISEALAAALTAVQQIRTGRFIAEPMDEYTCRNCHEAPFCPYINRI
ncbi:MAG: PD-(D/E)XK nuclease family protein [Nitrospiraceae bacterium]|nr:PD-(D/E)XK nuclease family protein [Nitrospiraceae bacterium]